MNRELMQKTRDRIAGVDADQCYMPSWILDPDDYPDGQNRQAVLTGEGMCSTAGCIAGHAIAVATGVFVGHWEDGDLIGYTDGETDVMYDDPEERGRALLGLTVMQSYKLFHMGMWPEKYKRLADDESQQKAMVALLDDILDGLTVWNDAHFAWETVDEWEAEVARETEEELAECD